MPYKSDAQRRFMHARHPGIAAKWDSEIRGAKKGKLSKVSKAKKDWAIGLSTAAVGGAIANQVPPYKPKRKKGKVKKAYTPVSTDPYFNTEVAQKTFDLIMKMDDDTAEVFCFILASDLLEQEIEKNLVTLQKHLDEVIAKQLSDVKKAMALRISKGIDEDPEPYARALVLLEEQISKATDDGIPNWQFERKIVRDQSTGRFRTKITGTTNKKPIDDHTAEMALKMEGVGEKQYKKLGAAEKAKYQNEYMQVAQFLQAVNAGTGGPGNNRVFMHYKNEKTGDQWAEEHNSDKPDFTRMLEDHVTVIGAEALPTALNAGGAAFSLSGAMGGNQLTPGQVEGINTFDTKYGTAGGTDNFATNWMGHGDTANTNARLYGRTGQLGEMAYTLGPSGSKVQLAGKMAQIAGQYGPQAESVLGPSARKTAYRYRGTERTPDKRLVSMYAEGIKENKRVGPIDPWAAKEEARIRTARGAGKQPFGPATGIKAKGSNVQLGRGEGPAPSLQQMVAQRQSEEGRAPGWQEREYGRRAASRYLLDRLPSKEYYKLHLEAGNTPPSEGMIINKDGQIVTQAVGYGDDHYLPFNLKNLKGLKGGEYIRTRSVGGLTSEDIYTGLISGARRVTVVSRSGTFTMEFQPDFRGGRRHNDKARRMTRRYEQILDAVQSAQVERQDVPKRWKDIIAQEVKDEYPPTTNKAFLRTEIDNRIKEFKENPKIQGRDEDRAEAAITRFEATATPREAADFRKEVMNELRDMKEIRFRLNGIGYKAALDSLEEQFPYYIHSQSIPETEHLEEFELDRGYVEPGRNRPTGAKAGWHGTAGKEKSGKFSAAHADYQRGKPGAPEPKHGPEAAKKKAAGTATEDKSDTSTSSSDNKGLTESQRKADAVADLRRKAEATVKQKSAAVDLHREARANGEAAPVNVQPNGTIGAPPAWWGMEPDTFRSWIEDTSNLKQFDDFITRNGATLANSPTIGGAYTAYTNARGVAGGKEFSKDNATIWPPTEPYTFTGEGPAYRPSPDPGVVQGEITRIDGISMSLRKGVPLSQLSEPEMKDEVALVTTIKEIRKDPAMKDMSADELQIALRDSFTDKGSGYVKGFLEKDGDDKHLKYVHQMRYLKRKAGPPGTVIPTPGGGSTAGFSTPPSSPPAAPPPSAPPAAGPVGFGGAAAGEKRSEAGGEAVVKPGGHFEVIDKDKARAEATEQRKVVASTRTSFVNAAVKLKRQAQLDGDSARYKVFDDFHTEMQHRSGTDMEGVLATLRTLSQDDRNDLERLIRGNTARTSR